MTDTFRKEYKTDADLKEAVTYIKLSAESLMKQIDHYVPHSREKALAITKLEECVMWATKAVYND